MIFTETKLKGAFIIDLDKISDERGFFARSWCQREFEKNGLNPRLVQCNISYNNSKGTLRGLHYQVSPCEEAKLVRCTMGAIFDVIVDLRPESPTFKHYFAEIITAEDRKMIYIPEGFAHGFLTLQDETEVHYQMSGFYSPDHARGVRWNDPAFGIQWPADVKIISDRDKDYPDFRIPNGLG
jgi:dTDP-4-dehydrorhamnose 3,5-epimerase